jgi:hypothetical protein
MTVIPPDCAANIAAAIQIAGKHFTPCVWTPVTPPLDTSAGVLTVSFRNIETKIHQTIILPVVLCGRETWSLTLTEEHGLRVFENRVLRRIFGRKRYEVTGEWRRLHNEELHGVYSSSNIIRVIRSRIMRLAGHVARMGDEVRTVLWRVDLKTRDHCEDLGVDGMAIETDLKETVQEGVDSICMTYVTYN